MLSPQALFRTIRNRRSNSRYSQSFPSFASHLAFLSTTKTRTSQLLRFRDHFSLAIAHPAYPPKSWQVPRIMGHFTNQLASRKKSRPAAWEHASTNHKNARGSNLAEIRVSTRTTADQFRRMSIILQFPTRTCSRRKPYPITRAGMFRTVRNLSRNFSHAGILGGSSDCISVRAITRFWICSCNHCVLFVGGRRRFWICARIVSSMGWPL